MNNPSPLGCLPQNLLPVDVVQRHPPSQDKCRRSRISSTSKPLFSTKLHLKGIYTSSSSSSSSSSLDVLKHNHFTPNMHMHLDPAFAGVTTAESIPRGSSSSSSRRSSTCLPSRRISTSVAAGSESTPLCVSDALVGLIAASCQVQTDLSELDGSSNTAPLRRLRLEAQSLKMTAQLLHKFLCKAEAGCLEREERASWIGLDVLIALLTAAILTVSELQVRLECMLSQAEELHVSVKEMYRRHGGSLTKDANRISMVDFTMTKLLSVLQVSDEKEARRHQSQAEAAVQDMLQADINLASRMQQLRDVSSGLELVPEQRRLELASHPPPGYSVPAPTDVDQLPTYRDALEDDSEAIQPRNWSVYSGLTFADIPVLSKITLPLILGEIEDGGYYTPEYAQSVREGLVAIKDHVSWEKDMALPQVLGIAIPKPVTVKAPSLEVSGFAHRLAAKVAKRKLLGR